jgi:hypothetical protein
MPQIHNYAGNIHTTRRIWSTIEKRWWKRLCIVSSFLCPISGKVSGSKWWAIMFIARSSQLHDVLCLLYLSKRRANFSRNASLNHHLNISTTLRHGVFPRESSYQIIIFSASMMIATQWFPCSGLVGSPFPAMIFTGLPSCICPCGDHLLHQEDCKNLANFSPLFAAFLLVNKQTSSCKWNKIWKLTSWQIKCI